MDIGTEELSHLEVDGTLARMHLKPMKTSREAAEADPLVAIAGGGGVTLCNSMGKNSLDIGEIAPIPGIVDQYYNTSTGENDEGDKDFTGPWNEGNGMEIVQGLVQPIAEATAAEVKKRSRRR